MVDREQFLALESFRLVTLFTGLHAGRVRLA